MIKYLTERIEIKINKSIELINKRQLSNMVFEDEVYSMKALCWSKFYNLIWNYYWQIKY